MSAHKTTPQPIGHIDDSRLPSGQCRYILLNPEIKGQRCACVGFTLNRALPSVTCECGHLSCYHLKSAEPPPDKTQFDVLLRRIQVLEEQLDRENQRGLGVETAKLVRRLGDLEEQVERNKDEASQDVKGCYRNVTRVWQSADHLAERQNVQEGRFLAYDERLDDLDDAIQRLSDRIEACNEASISLEERVEDLEDPTNSPLGSRNRRPSSTPDSERSRGRSSRTCRGRPRQRAEIPPRDEVKQPQMIWDDSCETIGRSVSSERDSMEWTVHVSLLPTASQPFPFEKDTTAYKRCLSRGLHRMVAVGGTDSESFVTAVTKTFGALLQGREWAPLEAQLCDAETLEGLPMLRPLNPALVGRDNYNLDFLCKHCAVCSPKGKAESLYIAMLSDTFSWRFLRSSPCHLEGLEAAWEFDSVLDRNDAIDGDDGASAGDMLTPLPTLKRTASTSFGSATATEPSDASRTKVARTVCVPVPMDMCNYGMDGVETI